MSANRALCGASSRAQRQDLRTAHNGKRQFLPPQDGFFCTLLLLRKPCNSPSITSLNAANWAAQSAAAHSPYQLRAHPGGANSDVTPHAF